MSRLSTVVDREYEVYLTSPFRASFVQNDMPCLLFGLMSFLEMIE